MRPLFSTSSLTCIIVGVLSAVLALTLSIHDSFIFLTWEPPFTLHMTFGFTPDIIGYCVDIINSTSSLNLYSQCGINTTAFSYPIPRDSVCCDYISYTVTPVNIVGNGTGTTSTHSDVQECKGTNW